MHHIEAVSVNHNTSAYMELMLRSLFARHASDPNLAITVLDNASEDDMTDVRAYAERIGVPIVQSGLTIGTAHNSHGEILRRFVLDHPDCSHYLFLDADVCFVQDNTLGVMVRELEEAPDAFGIMPKLSWDGQTEIPQDVQERNPDIYRERLHPCCALVRNTEVFQTVVEEIGLSCVLYLWAEREEYLDTFKLMTRVMRTHGRRHIVSSAMVIHFFTVSYDWDPVRVRDQKASRRDLLLADLRAAESRLQV